MEPIGSDLLEDEENRVYYGKADDADERGAMIEHLLLENFKAFESFKLGFDERTVIVGPNNAGKSTAISAVRLASLMIRRARSRVARDTATWKGEAFTGHRFDPEQFEFEDENIRHQFRKVSPSFELKFTSDAIVRAQWPPRVGTQPFFFITGPGNQALETPMAVKNVIPSIGLVPALTPLEPREQILREKTVNENLSTRLASRHFRNQLLLLDQSGEYEHFQSFCQEWIPEVTLASPEAKYTPDGTNVNVFYKEGVGEKEISWAGDGIQIFLQLLLHIYRLRDASSIIIDEPEVYLHADLQRRLLRVLDDVAQQAVVATHSPEIVAEAPPESITWVDKSRRLSVKAPSDDLLIQFEDALGSNLRLRLARVLDPSRLALFVEGKDMKLMRNVAATLGASRVAREVDLAVVELEGASNLVMLKSFKWVVDRFLGGAVKGFVILDRDYQSIEAIDAVEEQLQEEGLIPHVWRRKELESYLLSLSAIARLSGADESWVRDVLVEEANELKPQVLAQMVPVRQAELATSGIHLSTVMKRCQGELDGTWSDSAGILTVVPPKTILARVNSRLQADGHSAVSFRALSRALTIEEIPEEMCQVLTRVEEILHSI